MEVLTFSDKGQKPGPHDRLVTRAKPRNQPANLPAEPWAAPPGTLTVSLVRLRRPALPGRTKKVVSVTPVSSMSTGRPAGAASFKPFITVNLFNLSALD